MVDGPSGLALLVDGCLESEFRGLEADRLAWKAFMTSGPLLSPEGPQAAEDLAGARGEEGSLQAVDLIAEQFLGLGAGAGIRRVGLGVRRGPGDGRTSRLTRPPGRR